MATPMTHGLQELSTSDLGFWPGRARPLPSLPWLSHLSHFIDVIAVPFDGWGLPPFLAVLALKIKRLLSSWPLGGNAYSFSKRNAKDPAWGEFPSQPVLAGRNRESDFQPGCYRRRH